MRNIRRVLFYLNKKEGHLNLNRHFLLRIYMMSINKLGSRIKSQSSIIS
jgi:hypothetical protein